MGGSTEAGTICAQLMQKLATKADLITQATEVEARNTRLIRIVMNRMTVAGELPAEGVRGQGRSQKLGELGISARIAKEGAILAQYSAKEIDDRIKGLRLSGPVTKAALARA